MVDEWGGGKTTFCESILWNICNYNAKTLDKGKLLNFEEAKRLQYNRDARSEMAVNLYFEDRNENYKLSKKVKLKHISIKNGYFICEPDDIMFKNINSKTEINDPKKIKEQIKLINLNLIRLSALLDNESNEFYKNHLGSFLLNNVSDNSKFFELISNYNNFKKEFENYAKNIKYKFCRLSINKQFSPIWIHEDNAELSGGFYGASDYEMAHCYFVITILKMIVSNYENKTLPPLVLDNILFQIDNESIYNLLKYLEKFDCQKIILINKKMVEQTKIIDNAKYVYIN